MIGLASARMAHKIVTSGIMSRILPPGAADASPTRVRGGHVHKTVDQNRHPTASPGWPMPGRGLIPARGPAEVIDPPAAAVNEPDPGVTIADPPRVLVPTVGGA
jgi:hypothetical protein